MNLRERKQYHKDQLDQIEREEKSGGGGIILLLLLGWGFITILPALIAAVTAILAFTVTALAVAIGAIIGLAVMVLGFRMSWKAMRFPLLLLVAQSSLFFYYVFKGTDSMSFGLIGLLDLFVSSMCVYAFYRSKLKNDHNLELNWKHSTLMLYGLVFGGLLLNQSGLMSGNKPNWLAGVTKSVLDLMQTHPVTSLSVVLGFLALSTLTAFKFSYGFSSMIYASIAALGKPRFSKGSSESSQDSDTPNSDEINDDESEDTEESESPGEDEEDDSSEEEDEYEGDDEDENGDQEDELEVEELSSHEVLGVSEDAPFAEVRKRYLKLVQAYHPDKVATLAPEFREVAERKMKEINGAYADLERRKRAA